MFIMYYYVFQKTHLLLNMASLTNIAVVTVLEQGKGEEGK